jgi:hypothetical protein
MTAIGCEFKPFKDLKLMAAIGTNFTVRFNGRLSGIRLKAARQITSTQRLLMAQTV